ncbi:MAG: hypothetical protein DRJ40_01700 [Thermoprotei archaeon]|nr:MAG: hypothetical protein DRJ40_01700 [Thermoprotei archaeon]
MVKVLIINWKCLLDARAGGAEYYVRNLARALIEQGYRVTLLCSRCGQVHDKIEIDGYELPVHHCGTMYSIHLVAPYVAKSLRPDVVIESLGGGVPYNTTLLNCGRYRILLIHHIHTLQYFIEEPLHRAVGAYVGELLTTLHRSAIFVTVSRYVKSEVQRRYGIPRSRITVINPCTDSPKELHPKSSTPTITYLGRVMRYKFIDHVLYLTKLLKPHIPELRVIVAGRGNYVEFTRLRELAMKWGIGDVLELRWCVSEFEKWRILSSSWVYVLTSFREGFSITALEAETVGTPVVAYDCGGVRDCVVDGLTGYVVPWGDVAELAKRTYTLVTDSKLRTKFSTMCREWSRLFSYRNFRYRWSRLMDSIVSTI